jgi:hypothetical protein
MHDIRVYYMNPWNNIYHTNLEQTYKAYKFVMYEMQKKTRCVIHNGLAINLISTIDIYDKLVIVKGIFLKIYFNVHHAIKEIEIFFFYFLTLH